MAPGTCVTVAEPTPARMASRLRAALARSEYAEARLDFLRPADVPRALEAAGRLLRRTVCTVRPRSEGGRFRGGEAERASALALAAGYRPFLLDVEYSALRGDARLRSRLASSGARVMASWHDFGGTPGAAALRRRLASMSRYAGTVKIACTARDPADAARVLGLYAARGRTELVAFAMGEAGSLSRALCLHLGSPLTYAAIGRPAAPGQMGLAETRRLAGLRV